MHQQQNCRVCGGPNVTGLKGEIDKSSIRVGGSNTLTSAIDRTTTHKKKKSPRMHNSGTLPANRIKPI
jgi:hypothetical protein